MVRSYRVTQPVSAGNFLRMGTGIVKLVAGWVA